MFPEICNDGVALASACGGKPAADRVVQPGGSRIRGGKAADHQRKEGAVASAVEQAGGTSGEVPADGAGLFRRKLVVKIFPESIDDIWTFHSRPPMVQFPPGGRLTAAALRPGEQGTSPGGSSAMTPRVRNIILLVVMAFVAFLLWSTLSSQQVECSVTVEFQGQQGSGRASGASEEAAAREAQTAACGPLTGSMNDRITCDRVRPVSRRCRTL
jgi:hypothetical protein